MANPPNIGGFSLNHSSKYRPRLVVSIAGLDKSGKSHFALTAPGPIAYANYDTGLEGVVEKFKKKGKQVYSKDYRIVIPSGASIQETATKADSVWKELKDDVRAAYKSTIIRTVVGDTESEWWEHIRLSRFGKLTQVMPHHYGQVNSEYRDFLNEVYDSDKNLILLGKLKEEWENYVGTDGKEKGRKTGRLERVGFKEIPYVVQVNCITRFNKDSGFEIEIVNCRQNPDIAGAVMPAMDFPTLAQMVFPDSKESDWT